MGEPVFRPGSRGWRLAIRVGALLLAEGGRLPISAANALARRTEYTHNVTRADGRDKGPAAPRKAVEAARHLVGADVARLDGDLIIADDLADLAAWLADELEEHGWTVEP